MRIHHDGPILLDAPLFGFRSLARLTGVSEKSLHNWQDRGSLPLGTRRPNGRIEFSLRDGLKAVVARGLIDRVGMGPTDAAGAAEMVAREIEKRAPRDPAGHPVADLQSIPRTLALGFARVDGETQVGWLDPAQPGFQDPASPWSKPHSVVPVAPVLREVIGAFLALIAESAP